MHTRSDSPIEGRSSRAEGSTVGLDEACSDIAALAAQLCRAPVACLSFVGVERRRFAAPADSMLFDAAAATAFCEALSGAAAEATIVEDARSDARCATHPLVVADTGIRACAVMPIVRPDGSLSGVVCVLDTRPRAFDAAQVLALRMLARQAACLIDFEARTQQAESLAAERAPDDFVALQLADEERRKNGERLELALSGGDIGLWDLDLRSGKTTYNEQWGAMFGYALSEIEAVEDGFWKSIVHPDDYDGARDGLLRHENGETAMYEGEVRVRHKDGRWLWIQNRAKVVERDPRGLALRIVGVNLNITHSKQNVLALKRASDLLRRTSALAMVGGWELDPKAMTLAWSDEVFRIHDLALGPAPSVDAAIAFYAPEARPVIVAAVDACLAQGLGWDLELPLVTATGRSIWVRTLGSIERDADGKSRLVGTIQDMTEHKRMRERIQAEQQRLRLITDNVPASVTHLDKHQRYTFANRFSEQFFGVQSQDMLGRTMREVRGEKLYARLEPHIDSALQGKSVAFENEVFTHGGRFFMQSSFIPDFDAEGQVQGVYAMTFDVTERKLAEIRSADSERRLRGLTDNVPALLTELDLEERVAFCNGRYQTWLGIAPASIIGRPIREAVGNAHYELRKPLLDRAFAGEMVSFEQTTLLLVGERILQTTYLPQKDAEGSVVGLYVLANDVTDLKHKQMQLDALARQDALTGLPNRRSFEERAREAMVRSLRARKPICVVYLDIDHFKSINDSLGHAGGDAVLKEFGRRLRSSIRSTDMAARLAGDEFVMVLEGVHNEHGARLVAEKVLRSMEPAFCVEGRMMHVTTSMGLALSTVGEDDTSLLLGRADSALYAAKNAGRNCFMMAGAAVSSLA